MRMTVRTTMTHQLVVLMKKTTMNKILMQLSKDRSHLIPPNVIYRICLKTHQTAY